MTAQLKALCHDLARMALKNIKDCGPMEVQEFTDSLEEWVEQRQAVYAGGSEDES